MQPVLDSAPSVAPALAPLAVHDVLRDADLLVGLMGKEPLGAVAALADTLMRSAHEVGAWEIEEAASNLRRLASSRGPVALAGGMRALTEAIARIESTLAA
jgi:hypothetical protein